METEQKKNEVHTSKMTFWESWKTGHLLDKTNLVVGVVALIFSIPTILETVSKQAGPISVLTMMVLQNVLILLIFIFLYIHERRYRVEIETKSEAEKKHFNFLFECLASRFHGLGHEARDILNRVNASPINMPPSEVFKVLSQYCDDMKQILESVFGKEHLIFHATIKGIVKSTDGLSDSVVVLARDRDMRSHLSFRVSQVDSQEHPIFGNTAFQTLLNTNVTHFCDDDLSNRAGYDNTSNTWKERYNATLVVPIRRNNLEKSKELFELVGFIGVDCKPTDYKGAIFCDGRDTARLELKNIILAYADIVYAILKRGKTYHGDMVARQGDYRIDSENLDFVRRIHDSYLGRNSANVGQNDPDNHAVQNYNV